jgi:hypothetical protein
MPTPSTKRSARIVPGLLAGALVLAPLTACSFSSDDVSCSGSSCTVTLSGDGAKAEILGTTLTFAGVENGKATLSVAGASVSCGEGETVSAGPLRLECSSVTGDSVELTASLS